MRRLLREFADGGGTVLLSSHLLHEVDAIADQLILISSAGASSRRGSEVGVVVASTGMLIPPVPSRAGLERALSSAGIEFTVADDALYGDDLGRGRRRRGPGRWRCARSELRAAEGAGLEGLFLSLTSYDADGAGA